MPIPQVNDRIKEAPVVMLRAVFAGIGQILLTADKVRARAAEQAWAPERHTAPGKAGQARAWQPPQEPGNGHAEPTSGHPPVREAAAGTAAAAPAAKTAQATKTTPAAQATKTATVSKTTKGSTPPKTPSAAKTAKASPAAKAAPAPRAAKQAPAAKTAPAAKPKTVPAPRAAKTGPDAQPPPLPGYDDLSLASLRARLRALDAPAIEAMLAYEKAHARREPVITMLERRLAKLTAG